MTDSARCITAAEAVVVGVGLTSVAATEDAVGLVQTDTVAVDGEMDEAVVVERVEDAVPLVGVLLEALHAARALHRDSTPPITSPTVYKSQTQTMSPHHRNFFSTWIRTHHASASVFDTPF